jgi:hemoglobin-like flavoprotein
MDEPTPKLQFLQSLERCTRDAGFLPAFYARFLATSEEIRNKFLFTDFAHQNAMLLHSLRLAAAATDGDHEALKELHERAETHDRDHLNIEPRLYTVWLRAVIDTAKQFDGDWTDDLEATWRRILGYVTNYMIRHY